jgi:hypothetical protein
MSEKGSELTGQELDAVMGGGMIGCPKAARGAFWMRPANLTKP